MLPKDEITRGTTLVYQAKTRPQSLHMQTSFCNGNSRASLLRFRKTGSGMYSHKAPYVLAPGGHSLKGLILCYFFPSQPL